MPLTTITMLPEDIRDGVRKDCNRCPIALAVDRHLKPGYEASIRIISYGIQRPIEGSTAHEVQNGELPDTVRAFIRVFDAAETFPLPSPITFELDIAEEALK